MPNWSVHRFAEALCCRWAISASWWHARDGQRRICPTKLESLQGNMDQPTIGSYWYGYGSIPIDTFLVGWTSIYRIYQLFWGSLGTRVLTHPHLLIFIEGSEFGTTAITEFGYHGRHGGDKGGLSTPLRVLSGSFMFVSALPFLHPQFMMLGWFQSESQARPAFFPSTSWIFMSFLFDVFIHISPSKWRWVFSLPPVIDRPSVWWVASLAHAPAVTTVAFWWSAGGTLVHLGTEEPTWGQWVIPPVIYNYIYGISSVICRMIIIYVYIYK